MNILKKPKLYYLLIILAIIPNLLFFFRDEHPYGIIAPLFFDFLLTDMLNHLALTIIPFFILYYFLPNTNQHRLLVAFSVALFLVSFLPWARYLALNF
jgi:hypothetical protein